jgi:DNA-binding PadR family transcriptional regulator
MNDDMFNHYLSIGAIELSGIDSDGELTYAITSKAKKIAPELWQAHTEHVDNMIKSLYQDGLIDVEYDENLTAYFRLNEDGLELLKELGIFPIDTNEIPNN